MAGFMLLPDWLCWMDSSHGTYIGTSATIGANFRIDLINLTFRDCFHRAFINTRAACCTIIANYMSHCQNFLFNHNYLMQN